jgi:hypothetical protein
MADLNIQAQAFRARGSLVLNDRLGEGICLRSSLERKGLRPFWRGFEGVEGGTVGLGMGAGWGRRQIWCGSRWLGCLVRAITAKGGFLRRSGELGWRRISRAITWFFLVFCRGFGEFCGE